MTSDLRSFLDLAMQIGLGPRLQAMIVDVEAAIATYPAQADTRYLRRLEMQLDRLHNPDLRLIGAITREMIAQEPSLQDRVRPLISRLSRRHAYLRDVLNPL